ncbi:hypothetical protein GQ44DRAFT_698392 [Phaeosphaeriaceae sp. PMI808]|nr:hypothetical protein GQ44DRAFT_698392 [Phaeosphaeriaceae sp. PMI808]
MANLRDCEFPPLPSNIIYSRDQGVIPTKSSDEPDVHATISDLPDELLLHVLCYLPGIGISKGELASLASLSRTNLRFHRLVAGQLFATFRGPQCEPYLFLRTLCANPSLTELVRQVDLDYSEHINNSKRYRPCAQDKKIVKEGIRLTGVPGWKKWAMECNVCFIELDILYSAIIMKSPNITSLNSYYPRNYEAQKWVLLLRDSETGPYRDCRSRLKQLRIDFGGGHDLALDKLAYIFRISSLEELRLTSFFSMGNALESTVEAIRRRIPIRCNNLKELHLESCSIHPGILRLMVQSSRDLKALSFHMSFDMDAQLRKVTGMDIISMVDCHKKSLEKLEVRLPPLLEEPLTSSIGSFKGLRELLVLKHLACPLSMLVCEHETDFLILVERLPPSLESLYTSIHRKIRHTRGLIALENMAGVCSKYTPLLKLVSIGVHGMRSKLKYDWARLAEPFSQARIEFVVESKDEVDSNSFRWAKNDEESSESGSSDEVSL